MCVCVCVCVCVHSVAFPDSSILLGIAGRSRRHVDPLSLVADTDTELGPVSGSFHTCAPTLVRVIDHSMAILSQTGAHAGAPPSSGCFLETCGSLEGFFGKMVISLELLLWCVPSSLSSPPSCFMCDTDVCVPYAWRLGWDHSSSSEEDEGEEQGPERECQGGGSKRKKLLKGRAASKGTLKEGGSVEVVHGESRSHKQHRTACRAGKGTGAADSGHKILEGVSAFLLLSPWSIWNWRP